MLAQRRAQRQTPPAAAASDPVTAKVLEVVAGVTGYPSDMLDLELDLEADLGIDTVKQAETFAAVREAYDIPREDNLELRAFPTLGHVIQFVRDRRPDLVQTPTTAQQPNAGAAASDPVTAKVLDVVAGVTGYPSDMLDLELDLEADLGIDTVKQAETFAAVREAYDIPREDNLELRAFPTLGHVIQFVRDRRPDLVDDEPAAVDAAVSAGAEADTDAITAKVLEVVAEVTGYPSEMLELELDLEADLGIDTVKQAETFAAVRDAYGLERDDNLELREFPTLNHVIAWVKDRLPDRSEAGAGAGPAEKTEARPAAASTDDRGFRQVPRPVIRPALSFCKPTGVDLANGARVVIMADRGGVAAALIAELESRGVEVLALEGTLESSAVGERLESWSHAGATQGVFWLAGLDVENPIAELSEDEWKQSIHSRAKLLYQTMRALYDEIAESGSFLVTATRMGGLHGFGPEGASAPLGGAAVGFTKTYKREKPGATVKAVDFEAHSEPATIAERLLQEALLDPGVCEVGYTADGRWTIAVSHEPLQTSDPQPLGSDSVFIVTGAAGSIVSAIVEDLAKATGGTFHLLDLTPEPDPDDVDLQQFDSDPEGLQRTLFERLKESGEKATPVAVQKLISGLERKHAALKAIEAVRGAGGEAHYHAVNLLDREAVASVVEKVRVLHGEVDVLVHAAGLEISRFLPDKKPEEFDLVFDVKANGWYHLLSALGDTPLGAAVVFSSIAGRFGNGGQTDYSAANELLARSVSSFRRQRPNTRGIALDWTAWADIGMASRGSIPKMMEFAGIDMLDPAVGIPVVRDELMAGTRGELVIGGALGILVEEFDETGGLDPKKLEGLTQGALRRNRISMGVHTGLVVETELDPREQPFLYDHKIGGTAVLPGVMGIEGFGELATTLFPEWHISAIEGVEFMAPFKFYRDEPRTVALSAQFIQDGSDLVAECRLTGTRTIMGNEETTTHFKASVRLTHGPQEQNGEARADAPPPEEGTPVIDDDIYQVYFHGPAYQVLDAAWRTDGIVIGRMNPALPPDRQPQDAPMLTEPRLVELCFQTAGVWQIGTTGRMGLPQQIDRVQILRSASQAQGKLHAIVTPRDGGVSFDAHVADEAGNLYVVLRGYRTAELPEDVAPDKRKPLRAAMD